MFGIGFSELIVIFIVALVVLGPEKLQEFAKSLGKFISNVNNFSENIKEEINVSLTPQIENKQEKNEFKKRDTALIESKESDNKEK